MTALATAPDKDGLSFASDDERWDAVLRRDRAADGAFYYSVLTTGVYCRPSCAARLPRRENVRFHASREAAERAGFRPCKRCRPNEAPLAERQAALVAKACRAIEEADEMPSLDALADAAGMSRFHFHRVFKAVTGVTPKAYGAAQRAERVRDELAQGGTVTEAIYGAGFNSSGRFYAAAAGLLGMTPTRVPRRRQWRRDPLRGRPMLARLDPRRGDRQRRVRDRVRRRSGRARARPSGPLSEGAADRRR